jgi:hypothetical protein
MVRKNGKEMVMSKTLYIDADSLLYLTVFSRSNNGTDFDEQEGEDFGVVKPDMKALKAQFRALVHDIVTSCELESAIGNMTKFKNVVCVFTPSSNFRYDIFPDYKWRRTLLAPKPPEFYKLKKWAIKKLGICPEGIEADDYVSYMMRKGHPGTSADKDVFKQTSGYHYDTYHKCFVKTTKKEAQRFLCIQAVNGDITADDIPGLRTPKGNKYDGDKTVSQKPLTKTNPNGIGLARVGEIKAEKLLDGNYTLKNVIQIYLDHNFTKEYAITQIRLVHMGQIKKISRKGKIKLELYNG